MDQFDIEGGRKLKGVVEISGSKNAALPCLFATLLTNEPCVLERVPVLADIDTSIKLLETLGKYVKRDGQRILVTQPGELTGKAPYDLVRRMRASILVLGPLLARRGEAHVSLPGGCAIGARPINFHLEGFERMGAKIRIEKGYVDAHVDELKGRSIRFNYASVGATENIMMAAVLAKGETTIINAAREPEIVDLGHMLKSMGASIQGLGSSKIKIQGISKLNGTRHVVIPDRIETGTFIMAAAITQGDITLKDVNLNHLPEVIPALKKAGLSITKDKNDVQVKWVKDLKPVGVRTEVYPGFPTDLQAQWIALMSLTKGISKVQETVFENRFLHVQELVRFGADVQLNGREAMVRGVEYLSGCSVMVSDLRAGAALVLAGLAAKGKSTILRVYHLDRGYESMEKKLKKIGAKISRSNPKTK